MCGVKQTLPLLFNFQHPKGAFRRSSGALKRKPDIRAIVTLSKILIENFTAAIVYLYNRVDVAPR